MCRFHVDTAQFKRDREKAERAVRKLKQAEPKLERVLSGTLSDHGGSTSQKSSR